MPPIKADASPEKRLFISLLTRDIPLQAAFLDLIDNSVNSALEPYADRLKSAKDYLTLLSDKSIKPKVTIKILVTKTKVEITDNALGIRTQTAQDHVFKFGRSGEDKSNLDRLSVYGIGLKRAIFKLGNRIDIQSDHKEGGFDLHLDVNKWEHSSEQPWTMPITERKPANKTGTTITASQLHEDVKRRLEDGLFLGKLEESIARTYTFFLSRLVRIELNGKQITGDLVDIGNNRSSSYFSENNVSCAIAAGIGKPEGGKFRDRNSGWFVFCNGRAVISADKTSLTGWSQLLPIFQPKHRPFTGFVFFVSSDPENLPWTTTKATVNEDSTIWQTAKRKMSLVAKEVITFLDSRYTDEGTEFSGGDVEHASGGGRISALAAAGSSTKSNFKAPSKKTLPKTTRVQYDAKIDDINRIAKYVDKREMSGSEVGRLTFNYYLTKVVGE